MKCWNSLTMWLSLLSEIAVIISLYHQAQVIVRILPGSPCSEGFIYYSVMLLGKGKIFRMYSLVRSIRTSGVCPCFVCTCVCVHDEARDV